MTFRVNISKDQDQNNVEFSIIDTGVGIAEDRVDAIFQQFTQADTATTRTFGGTGLGLSISQQLVQLMGGNITVTSELGTGSEFTFTLDMPVTDVISKDRPSNPETKWDSDLSC